VTGKDLIQEVCKKAKVLSTICDATGIPEDLSQLTKPLVDALEDLCHKAAILYAEVQAIEAQRTAASLMDDLLKAMQGPKEQTAEEALASTGKIPDHLKN
jgi:hypothetical protein